MMRAPLARLPDNTSYCRENHEAPILTPSFETPLARRLRMRDGGGLMRQHRPRIARTPAIGLDQRDEALDHFVKQRRLFQIENVARLGKQRQPRCGKMFL